MSRPRPLSAGSPIGEISEYQARDIKAGELLAADARVKPGRPNGGTVPPLEEWYGVTCLVAMQAAWGGSAPAGMGCTRCRAANTASSSVTTRYAGCYSGRVTVTCSRHQGHAMTVAGAGWRKSSVARNTRPQAGQRANSGTERMGGRATGMALTVGLT